MKQRIPGQTLLLALIVLLGQSHTVLAATNQELQLSHRYSRLNKGLSDWSDWRLLWSKKRASGDRFYLEVKDILHFDARDQNLALGYYQQLTPGLLLQTELSTSSEHNLFPAYSVYGGVEKNLDHGLILTAGLRLSHFSKIDPVSMLNSSADSLLFTGRLEYYKGNHLYVYDLYYTHMQGPLLADSVMAQGVKYAYIYDDRSNISIRYNLGGEIDFDPASAALSGSDIQSVSLGGMHWRNQTLAIVYTVATHSVSSTNFGYRRNELYLGFRKLN